MQPEQPVYQCPAGHECPNYTDDDMNGAYERGLAEGRRQATEGWARESSEPDVVGGRRWSRLVGPWEPGPEPSGDDRG